MPLNRAEDLLNEVVPASTRSARRREERSPGGLSSPTDILRLEWKFILL